MSARATDLNGLGGGDIVATRRCVRRRPAHLPRPSSLLPFVIAALAVVGAYREAQRSLERSRLEASPGPIRYEAARSDAPAGRPDRGGPSSGSPNVPCDSGTVPSDAGSPGASDGLPGERRAERAVAGLHRGAAPLGGVAACLLAGQAPGASPRVAGLADLREIGVSAEHRPSYPVGSRAPPRSVGHSALGA